ncbi:hypothetical protein BASA81_001091 [Batrachochytrium salamandrivorans]|nr:hypothetical protein BASA81_001091 [Batrachochytrium salamandrivorans]
MKRNVFWSLVGLAVLSSYFLLSLNINLPLGYHLPAPPSTPSSPIEGDVYKLLPPPAPKFARFPVSVELNGQETLASSLVQLGWQELANATGAKIVLVESKSGLFGARRANAEAFISAVNSPCLWGSPSTKLSCLRQFAIASQCPIQLLVSSRFGYHAVGAKTNNVVLFIRSVNPWSVLVSGKISPQAKPVVEFALQAIQRSLKDDVYRGVNMFQALELLLTSNLQQPLLQDIVFNPNLHEDVWQAALEAANIGEEEEDALWTHLPMHDRLRCRTPNLFEERFPRPAQAACGPSQVRFGSEFACSTLAKITQVQWNNNRTKCGLGKLINLIQWRNLGRDTSGVQVQSAIQCSPTGMTYKQANQFCIEAGARLCSLQEVTSEAVARGMGCKGELQRTWTSTRCSNDPLAFWVSLGGSKLKPPPPPVCLPYQSTKFVKPLVARCCADETPPTCLRERDSQVFLPGDAFKACIDPDTIKLSALSCVELGFKSVAPPSRTNNNFNSRVCHQPCEKRRDYTYCEANAYCQSLGGRLCTKLEQSAVKCEAWALEDAPANSNDCSSTAIRKRKLCCGDESGRRRVSLLLALLASFGVVLLFSTPPPLPTTPSSPISSVSSIKLDNKDDDYAAYSELESRDDDASFFERIERAQIAPVELIGKVPALQVGSLLQSTLQDNRAFPLGSLVMVTELGSDFYRGVIINSPLPVSEQDQAKQMLRVSDAAAPKPILDRVLFYGYGGPVKTQEHQWQIVHDNVHAVGAVVIGSDRGHGIAVGGDFVHELLVESTRILLLYGSAVWLPGQLEREILQQHGVWQLLPGKANTFDDLLRLCHL